MSLAVSSSIVFNPLKCARVKPRRSKNRFQAPNAALNLFEAKGPAKDVRENLLTAIQGTDRGVTCNEEKKKEILKLTEELAEIGKEQVTTGDSLSGTWKLAWTTEQEVLFLLKNASWFGTKAGEVYQVINVPENSLQNVISFPPEGAFVVTSSIQIASQQRVSFKFNKARLDLPEKRTIPFPPFGKGWFESLYMDDVIRVAYDIRGDTLVALRDGDPKVF